MALVRTLVVTLSPLLADLVLDVLRPHCALDVVGVLATRDQLAERLHTLRPDLVLLGLAGNETDASAGALLAVAPSAGVLALAPNGEHAWLHEMRPHRTVLHDLSVAALLGALGSRLDDVPPADGDATA